MRRLTRLVVVTAAVFAGATLAWAANDPGFDRQWNMRTVGAETAWTTGTGTDITVAVVDSGIHLSHEDLSGRIVAGWNFVEDNATAQDDHGHGTHVAGIVGATANNGKGVVGVAPGVRLMPVRVLRADGSGSATGSGADVEAGIRWAADHGAQVINLSLGSDLQGLPLMGPSFVSAIEYAWNKGAISVVAAGNSALKSSGFNQNTNAIVVTATDEEDQKASYASPVGGFFNGTPKWGMAAPGGAGTSPPNEDDILSTYGTTSGPADEYAWMAGTSMAAPLVSGAVAILRSLGLSRDQAVARVTQTAKDLGNPGKDSTFGWGRLDVAKAVEGLARAGGTATTTTGAGTATTTTASTGRKAGGSTGATSPPTTPRAAPGPSSAAGAANGSASAPPAMEGSSDPATPEDDRVSVVELGPAEQADGPDPDDGADTSVWPAGLLALAALGAVTTAAVRGRRLRV